MAATQSLPIGIRWELALQQRIREANLRAREHQEEPPWRQEIRESIQDTFGNRDRKSYDVERPCGYASASSAGRGTEIPELDTNPPYPEEQSSTAMRVSHRSTSDAELPTYEGQSSTPMPTSCRSTSDAELPVYEEQPAASDVEVSAYHDRVIPPEAPSGDATATELQEHLKRLVAGLRAADRRIKYLEAQQNDSRQAYIRAVFQGQEAELSSLKRTLNAFKELLEEAQRDRDKLQRELREGRAREAELEERMHRTNLEQMRLTAEVERMGMGAGTSHTESIAAPRLQSFHEEEIPRRQAELGGQLHRANIEQMRSTARAERLNMGSYMDAGGSTPPCSRLDEVEMPRGGGRPYRAIGGWDFPKGQVPWFKLVFLP